MSLQIQKEAAARAWAPVPELEEGRLEVRPIGTTHGLRELAALHKRTWSGLDVREKRVFMLLWPSALHFGFYLGRPAQERRRPQLIAAFWARCLADAPITLGHLYPPALFKGVPPDEVFEFGGAVVNPTLQKRGLMRLLANTARLFLYSRRPKLIITIPIESLYPFYKSVGLKTVGTKPVNHPYMSNVKAWLMYGRFDELSKPFFM